MVWLWALTGWTADGFFFRPIHIYRLADWLTINGVWGIGDGEPVAGVALWAVWIVEALILLGVGAVFPFKKIAQTPYSETDDAWADHAEMLPPLKLIPPDERQDFYARLAAGDVGPLVELAPAEEGAPSWTRYQLVSTQPDGGGREHFLSIHTVEEHLKSTDETVVVITPVVRHLVIDPEARRLIAEIVREKEDADGGDEAEGPNDPAASDTGSEPEASQDPDPPTSA